ncbi:MAG TPA: AAA family ATPase [Acidimicrobiales bacterium]|nr:AAA family ATPase [Acidimicrobiales bacterium]
MILVLSASDELEQAVREAVGDAVRVETAPLERGLAAAIPAVEVAIVDGTVDPERAFTVAQRFDEERPDVTVVLHMDPTGDAFARAMQVGVRDILPPASDGDRIRESVKRALEVAERRATTLRTGEGELDQHRLIMVLSPKGGAGKTTVATNLAVGLASRVPKQVVLVDGDLQFGDVGNALRLLSETSIRDAIAGGLHDATEVKVHLTPHRSGLFALCAPEVPGVADEITAQAFSKAVVLLHREFKYVVVDTDPGLGERTLTVMDNATDLVFVAATDVASVRGLHKTVDALDRIGMTAARRHFVLNRADAKVGLEIADIAATIGTDFDVLLPSHRSLPVSMNQGVPVLEAGDGSPAVGPLWQLVDRFEPDPNATAEQQAAAQHRKASGGLFGRRG